MLGLEAVLLRVLELYFGEFVESLNKEQLKVGVLKGRVVLRDLRLRKGACLLPGVLPVAVRQGRIAELAIQVPWSKLSSEPVVVRVVGVHADLEPAVDEAAEDAATSRRAQERKLRRLDAAELVAQQQQQQQQQQQGDDGDEDTSQSAETPSPLTGDSLESDDTSSEASEPKQPPPTGTGPAPGHVQQQRSFGAGSRKFFRRKSLASPTLGPHKSLKRKAGNKKRSFRSKLLRRIFHNIQFHVQDLHVSYTDDVTLAPPGKRCELDVERLHISTVDPLGDPTFHSGPEGGQASLGEVLARAIRAKDVAFRIQGDCVLGPSDWSVRTLQGLDAAAATRLGAKLTVKIESQALRCRASASHVRAAVSLLQPLVTRRELALLLERARLRPATSPRQDPRAWWVYAFTMVKLGLPSRPAGFDLVQAVKTRSHYIALYRQKLHYLAQDQTPPAALSAALRQAEVSMAVDAVLLFRQMARRESQVPTEDLSSPETPPDAQHSPGQAAVAPPLVSAGALASFRDAEASRNEDGTPSSETSSGSSRKSASRASRKFAGSFRRGFKAISRSASQRSTATMTTTTTTPPTPGESATPRSPPASAVDSVDLAFSTWPSVAQQILYEEVSIDAIDEDPSFAAFRTGWMTRRGDGTATKDLQALLRIENLSAELLAGPKAAELLGLRARHLSFEFANSASAVAKHVSLGLAHLEGFSHVDESIFLKVAGIDALEDFHATCDDTFTRAAALHGDLGARVAQAKSRRRRRQSAGRLSAGSLQGLLRSSSSTAQLSQLTSSETSAPPSPQLSATAVLAAAAAAGGGSEPGDLSLPPSASASSLSHMAAGKSLFSLYQDAATTSCTLRFPKLYVGTCPALFGWIEAAMPANEPHRHELFLRLVETARKRSRGSQSKESVASPKRQAVLNVGLDMFSLAFRAPDHMWALEAVVSDLQIAPVSEVRAEDSKVQDQPIRHLFDLGAFEVKSHADMLLKQPPVLVIQDVHIPTSRDASGICFVHDAAQVILSPLSSEALTTLFASLKPIAFSRRPRVARSGLEDKTRTSHSPARFELKALRVAFVDTEHQDVLAMDLDGLSFARPGPDGGWQADMTSAVLTDPQAAGDGEFATLVHIPEGAQLTLAGGVAAFASRRVFVAWNHTLPGRLAELKASTTVLAGLARDPTGTTESSTQHDLAAEPPKDTKKSKAPLHLRVQEFIVELREEGLERGLLRFTTELDAQRRPDGAIDADMRQPRLQSAMSAESLAFDLLRPYRAEGSTETRGGEYLGKISLQRAQRGAVHVIAEEIEYVHFHTEFKELVDYLEYGVSKPLAQLRGAKARIVTSSSSSSHVQPTRMSEPKAAPGLKIDLRDCLVSLPASRSVEQHLTSHARFELRSSTCSIERQLMDGAHGTQVFEVAFSDLGLGSADVASGSGYEPILAKDAHRSASCRWTRTRFTDREAETRRALFVKGLDGIRSWYGNPSGHGFRNQLEWNFGQDQLALKLSHRQYNLFNIVQSENFTDWRSLPHVCSSDARDVADTCFCRQLATETLVLETRFHYLFPPVTELQMRFLESSQHVFRLRVHSLVYDVEDHLRYGRKASFSLAGLEVQGRHADAEPLRQILVAPAASVKVERDKSRDTTMTIQVQETATALLDRGALQQFLFFFEGDHAERLRLGCPTSFGPDPVHQRRAKNTQRVLSAPHISVRTGLEHGADDICLEGSLHTISSKSAQQLRSAETTLRVDRAHFQNSSWNFIEKPVEVHLHSSKTVDQDHFQRRVSASLSELRILLSHRDLAPLSAVLSQWHTETYTRGQRQLHKSKRAFYQANTIQRTVSQAVYQLNGVQIMVVDTSDANQHGALPLVAIVSSPFIVREVVETLADSGRRIATYEGDFTDLVATHESKSDIYEKLWCGSESRQGITVAVFNFSIAKWEPLLEPYVWEWTLQRTSNAVNKMPTAISFQLQGPRYLMANVSAQGARTLTWLHALYQASQDERPQRFPAAVREESESLAQQALMIENQTGMQIMVYGRNHKGPEADRRRIENRERVSVGQKEVRVISLELFDASGGSPWYRLEGVPVHTVGCFVYVIYPRDRNSLFAGGSDAVAVDDMDEPVMATQVSVDVKAHGARMHVRVSSIFELRNETLTAVDILLLPTMDPVTQHQSARAARIIENLGPGDSLNVPVDASHCTLTLRPHENASLDWWEGIELGTVDSLTGRAKRTATEAIRCDDPATEEEPTANSVRGRSIFAACMTIRPRRSSNQLRVRHLYAMTISSLMTIENLLPVGLQFAIASEEIKTPDRREIKTVPAGSQGGVYGWPAVATKRHLQLRIDNAEWTRSVDLNPANTASSPLSVVVLDESGKQLRLLYEVRRPDDGKSVVVTVFSRAWFLNRTGLALSFKAGNVHLMESASRALDRRRQQRSARLSLLRHGQAVRVRAPEGWAEGVIYQVHKARGTYDVLFASGALDLDVPTSRLRTYSLDQEDTVQTNTRDADADGDGDGDGDAEDVRSDDEAEASEKDGDDGGESVAKSLDAESTAVSSAQVQPSEPIEHVAKGEQGPGLGSVMLFSESSMISVRVAQSQWSSPCSLESVGTQGSIQLPMEGKRESLGDVWCQEIGVHVGLAPSKFRRTKIVTFVPRYLIVNDLAADLVIAQSSSESLGTPIDATRVTVGAGREKPLMLVRRRGARPIFLCLTLRASGETYSWTAAFNPAMERMTAIKVRSVSSSQVLVLRLQIVARGACCVVRVAATQGAMDGAAYRLENASSQLVHYFQDIGQPVLDAESAANVATARLDQEAARAAAQARAGSSGGGAGDPALGQRAFAKVDRMEAGRRGIVERLFPNETAAFGWDTVNVADLVLVLSFCGDTQLFSCALDELNQRARLQLPGGAVLIATTFFDGRSKVLRLADEGALDDRERAGSLAWPGGDAFASPRGSVSLQVGLAGVGISFVDAKPQEIAYVTAAGLGADLVQHPNADQSLEIVLTHLQIDNQLPQARLPIAMVPLPRDQLDGAGLVLAGNGAGSARASPFVHFSLVERKALGSRESRYLEYVGLCVHEFALKVEAIWALRVARMWSECAALKQASLEQALFHGVRRGDMHSAADESSVRDSVALDRWIRKQNHALLSPSLLDEELSNGEEYGPASQERERERGERLARRDHSRETSMSRLRAKRRTVYIEWLEVHPLKAQLGLQTLVEDRVSQLGFPAVTAGPQEESSPRPFDVRGLVAALPLGISDVEDATLFLSAMFLHNVLLTPGQVKSRISRHFSSQALSQLYRVIGSSELLGNPIGLVTNLGSGLRDLFYEPAQGFVQSPEAFGAGLARGTTSFVHHTAFGTFDTVSKLSTSLSSGVALLSLDQRYLTARRAALMDERPRHVGDGLLLGAKSLGLGLTTGLTGIVTEPMRGAEEEGVEGFFKGVGIGLLGVAIKPTVGVLDMVGRLLAGIKSTAALLDMSVKPQRQRLPRVLHGKIKQMRAYDSSAAFVQSLMQSVWGGEGAPSDYVRHLPLPGNLLLVAAGYDVGCIDYSSFVSSAGAGDSGASREADAPTRSAQLLWRVDTRMVLQTKQMEDEDGRLSLRIRVSDVSSLAYTASALVSLRMERHAVELVLRGKRSVLGAVDGMLKEAMSLHESELEVDRGARADFGLTLSPVPESKAHAPALGAVRELGQHMGVGLVTRVREGSLADQAEIAPGDYLVALGGSSLSADEYGEALADAVADLPTPSSLEIVLWRRGRWLFKRVPL